MPALTVHNAEIKTAAVEIRTLTISGKQVTLAVFRQLREEPLLAEDGTLNGVPWGTVNYHPAAKQCDDLAEHWHVVWQKGSDLLRSTVTKVVRWNSQRFWPDSGSAFFAAHVRDVLSGAGSRFWGGEVPGLDTSSRRHADLITPERGVSVCIDADESVWTVIKQHRDISQYVDPDGADRVWWSSENGRSGTVISRSAALRASEYLLDTALADLHSVPIADVHREFVREIDSELERRRRHDDARLAIADLPQLFIAV